MHELAPYVLCCLCFAFTVWQTITQRRDYRQDRDKLLHTFLAREELWLDQLGQCQQALVASSGLPVPRGATLPGARAPSPGHNGAGMVQGPGEVPLSPDELEILAAQQGAREALARAPVT